MGQINSQIKQNYSKLLPKMVAFLYLVRDSIYLDNICLAFMLLQHAKLGLQTNCVNMAESTKCQ